MVMPQLCKSVWELRTLVRGYARELRVLRRFGCTLKRYSSSGCWRTLCTGSCKRDGKLNSSVAEVVRSLSTAAHAVLCKDAHQSHTAADHGCRKTVQQEMCRLPIKCYGSCAKMRERDVQAPVAVLARVERRAVVLSHAGVCKAVV
jgi:hypothetical protein